VLAVVLALWINLAVQPCAMAMGTDGDCPHCPPAVEHDMPMAHGHHDMDMDPDCATFGTDCGEIDDFGIDSRGAQAKIKDKAEFLAVPAALPPDPVPGPLGFSTAAVDPPEPAAAPPPKYLLNCVFLD
jgi:hypothetical protein